MNNQLVMQPQPVDFDRIFAHRGGFKTAVGKLRAYALTVIEQRKGPTKNGRKVEQLDAWQLVRNALSRLVEMESLDDGEAVYFQLRRHIDNEVHGVQKKVTPDPMLVPIAAGTPNETSREVPDPEDCNATDVADSVERSTENEFYREMLLELQKQYKPTSIDFLLIEQVIEGWRDRGEIAELLGITTAQYDAAMKRVSRAACTLKETALKRTAK